MYLHLEVRGGACMFRFYIHSFHRSVKHWLRSVTPTYTCVSHRGEGSSALSEGYSELSRGCACPSVGLCWTQNNYNKREKLTLGFSGKNWREFLSLLKAFSGPSVGWGEASPISTDSCIWEDTWIWKGTAIYMGTCLSVPLYSMGLGPRKLCVGLQPNFEYMHSKWDER